MMYSVMVKLFIQEYKKGAKTMGYERKLYVVSEWETSHSADVIATIDLSKVDYDTFKGLFRYDAAYPIYLLEPDNEIKVTEDKYGEHIKSEYPDEVLKALTKDYKLWHYWRDKVAIDLIKSIVKNDTDLFSDERIMIYSYGY